MNELDILRDRLVAEEHDIKAKLLLEDDHSNHCWYSGFCRGISHAINLIADIKDAREKNQETS